MIKVKVIKEGQPRPYADSEYEYEIEAQGFTEWEIKQFCTKALRGNNTTYGRWMEKKDSDLGVYFGGYHILSKKGDKYYYYVKEPYSG